jgi:hypothetical protein
VQVYIAYYMCLSGCNGIYKMYAELQWRFLKIKSCSGVSQIAKNYNGVYPVNSLVYKVSVH